MNNIFLKAIDFYQRLPLASHGSCRFYPTCSEYMKQAIIIHGTPKGILYGAKRIIRCNPFGKHGIDLVPPKERGSK